MSGLLPSFTWTVWLPCTSQLLIPNPKGEQEGGSQDSQASGKEPIACCHEDTSCKTNWKGLIRLDPSGYALITPCGDSGKHSSCKMSQCTQPYRITWHTFWLLTLLWCSSFCQSSSFSSWSCGNFWCQWSPRLALWSMIPYPYSNPDFNTIVQYEAIFNIQ